MNKKLGELVLLDLGCGTGNYILPLTGIVSKIYAVEYNEGMIEEAKKKC